MWDIGFEERSFHRSPARVQTALYTETFVTETHGSGHVGLTRQCERRVRKKGDKCDKTARIRLTVRKQRDRRGDRGTNRSGKKSERKCKQ